MTGPSSPTGLATATTVTVKSAVTATQLLSQMPAGTQIVNNDLTNSVWISENQSTTPGNGFELGAQGSCTWQYDKQPAYAILDTAATGPVSVTFGNSVSNITNPLFVAEALAIKGIPNVLVEDDLGVFTMPFGPIDVSKYATVFFQTSAGASSEDINWSFTDANGNTLGIGQVGVRGDGIHSTITIPFSIPVTGPFLGMASSLQPNKTVHLTATNRETDRPINQWITTNTAQLADTDTFSAGSNSPLGLLNVSGGRDLYVTMRSTGFGGFHPLGIFVYQDYFGQQQIIGDTAEMHLIQPDDYVVEKVIPWPTSPGYIRFIANQSGGPIGGTVGIAVMGN